MIRRCLVCNTGISKKLSWYGLRVVCSDFCRRKRKRFTDRKSNSKTPLEKDKRYDFFLPTLSIATYIEACRKSEERNA